MISETDRFLRYVISQQQHSINHWITAIRVHHYKSQFNSEANHVKTSTSCSPSRHLQCTDNSYCLACSVFLLVLPEFT